MQLHGGTTRFPENQTYSLHFPDMFLEGIFQLLLDFVAASFAPKNSPSRQFFTKTI